MRFLAEQTGKNHGAGPRFHITDRIPEYSGITRSLRGKSGLRVTVLANVTSSGLARIRPGHLERPRHQRTRPSLTNCVLW